VLQITVHQNGSVSITMIQTGNQRHLVPESTRQVQNRDPRVPGCNLLEHGERIVTAPVEHIQDTKGVSLRQRGQDTGKRRVKNWQPLFLIVNGQNNIDGHSWSSRFLAFDRQKANVIS
jgi:hypothetical protein